LMLHLLSFVVPRFFLFINTGLGVVQYGVQKRFRFGGTPVLGYSVLTV
jgi:hypothetical protein